MEARLVADPGEERRFESGSDPCGGGNIAIDAGEAAVGVKGAGRFWEEEVVGGANRHAICEEEGEIGGSDF